MLANMASSLILQKRITTTTAKAKALRTFVEPLITRSKEDSTHSRRMVFNYLRDKHAVTELFRDVAEKVGDRPGGYTRIIKTGYRLGDNADMCIIELVDYNENMLAEKTAEKPKASRRRRGGKKKSEEGPEAITTDVMDVEETATEEPEALAEAPPEKPEVTADTAEEPETAADTAEEPETAADTAEAASAEEDPAESAAEEEGSREPNEEEKKEE